MLNHKPWLQHATPSEAEGQHGQILPAEGDLVWKFFRIDGVHLVIVFVYFDANIGLSGATLEQI